MKNVTAIKKQSNVAQLRASADPETRQRRSISAFLAELKQRRVCRAGITYVMVMWFNLQIGDVLFPMLGVPDWALKLIVVLGAMGLPAVLVLAWVFQITSNGIVIDRQDDAGDNRAARTMDSVVNTLLLTFALVLTVLLTTQSITIGSEARHPADRNDVLKVQQ